MARSKAQKARAHKVRNGRRDPALKRGEVDFSTHVRKTPSRQERIDKSERKYSRAYS